MFSELINQSDQLTDYPAPAEDWSHERQSERERQSDVPADRKNKNKNHNCGSDWR